MFKNIAVLIDADNISSQKIDWIFAKIHTLGNISTQRIYGDFTKAHLSSWESFILKYAIEKKHQTSYSTGKNSSDIALAIDAIDLWHTNDYDAFCIISSDSDFIGLSLRLRRNNIQVFGFGNANTIKEFRQVCSEFFEIPSDTNAIQKSQPITKKEPVKKFTANQLKCDTKLLNALRESIANNKPDNDGWVNYSVFSAYLKKHHSAITPENYGYAKLYEMIDAIDLFDAKKENSAIFIRLKPSKNSQTISTKTVKTQTTTQWSSDKLTQNTQLINAIKDSINKTQDNGWANFGTVIQYLRSHYSSLNPNTYGFTKWTTLIKKIDLFETKQINKTTLSIREKSSKPSSAIKAIDNQKLLDDILQIINDDNLRKDEWVHIGYLGSQLKNKGYNPKDFGKKTFGLLLSNLQGLDYKSNNGDYYTLTDKSNIKPIIQNPSPTPNIELEIKTPSAIDLKDTRLYQVFIKNKDKLNSKIKELLTKNNELSVMDFWALLSKNLSAQLLLDNNQSHACFLQFVEDELHDLQLITKDGKTLFSLK